MRFLVDTYVQKLKQARDSLESRKQALTQKESNPHLIASVLSNNAVEDLEQPIFQYRSQLESLSNILEDLESLIFELHCLSRIFEVLFLEHTRASEQFVAECSHVIEALANTFDKERKSDSTKVTQSQVVTSEIASVYTLLDFLLEQYRLEILARLDTDLKSQVSRNKFCDAFKGLGDLLVSRLKFHESEVRQWQSREEQCEADSTIKASCARRRKSNEKLQLYALKAVSLNNDLISIISSRS